MEILLHIHHIVLCKCLRLLCVGHRLGHGSTDLAKVNNPRNIVTPTVTPPPRVVTTATPTATPNGTPTTGGTPAVTPPRKLSSSSLASSTSSFSISKSQQQERDPEPDATKQKLGVASLSNSSIAGQESSPSTTTFGQLPEAAVHASGGRWDNEVEKPAPRGDEEQGQQLHNQFGNEIEVHEGQIFASSTHTNKIPAGGTAPSLATASVAKPNQVREGDQVVAQPPPLIQLTSVGDINTDDDLNDLDECETEGQLRFPLKPMGDPVLVAKPPDGGESTQSPVGNESHELKGNVIEEQPGDSSAWGVGFSLTPSFSKPGEQIWIQHALVI